MSEFAQQHAKPGTKLVGARNDLASKSSCHPNQIQQCVSPAPPQRDRWEDSLTESLGVERDSSIDLPGDSSPTAHSMRLVYERLDWSATPLGPRDSWPALLRLVVDLCLDSEFPVQISWGPGLLVLYNDAYIPYSRSTASPATSRWRSRSPGSACCSWSVSLGFPPRQRRLTSSAVTPTCRSRRAGRRWPLVHRARPWQGRVP